MKSCKDTHFVLEPSTTVCEGGVWKNKVTCSPKTATCTSTLPTIANGKLVCPVNTDEASGNYLGGTVCDLTCDAGFLKTGVVQCINSPANAALGIWSDGTCGNFSFRL